MFWLFTFGPEASEIRIILFGCRRKAELDGRERPPSNLNDVRFTKKLHIDHHTD